ncbi:uncharacterized protein [Dermacentor andersoni]|uniref:uncharacterized protein n=1 Tax=Dermacentor andersoni TaxID=34620 RepID=UPI003B3A4EA0
MMKHIKSQIIDNTRRYIRGILGLDREKAVDNVSHAHILNSISELNLGDALHRYISSFLRDRKATLKISDLKSDNFSLRTGVRERLPRKTNSNLEPRMWRDLKSVKPAAQFRPKSSRIELWAGGRRGFAYRGETLLRNFSLARARVRRLTTGARNKWVHFPKTAEEKAAVKEGFLRRGVIPGVIGCVDGSLIAIIAPKGERKAVFMCRKGYYALNCMFICDADMKILALDPRRPGSDHDAFVWRTTWLRRRFQVGRIVNAGEYLLGDSGYPLEPWLLTPVPGHPPVHTAEGQYNTAHAAMRSVVERCIGLLKSRFRCLQRYRTLLYEPERAANIVAASAVLHNLRLSEGDESGDDSDDDSSSSSSRELYNNGDPMPHSLPRNTGSRMHYLRGF